MPNPTTLIDGEERLNSEITRDYLCSLCYGELVERYEPAPLEGQNHWLIQCNNEPAHHGFLRRTTAYYRERKEGLRDRG